MRIIILVLSPVTYMEEINTFIWVENCNTSIYTKSGEQGGLFLLTVLLLVLTVLTSQS
jgi:hypothetical protein